MRRSLTIFGTLAILALLPYSVHSFYPDDAFDACNVLRETVQKQDALTSDAAVDLIMATFGPLDRSKCVALAVRRPLLPLSPEEPRNAAPASLTLSERQTIASAQLTAAAPKRVSSIAEKEISAAINKCMAKRISGELSGYGASARCAASLVDAALDKANYPHMDLITLFNLQRIELFQRCDRNEVDEAYLAREQYRLITEFIAAERSKEEHADGLSAIYRSNN